MRGIFYGWVIVGAGTLIGTLQSVVFNLGAAALFLPVAREFATTRTVVSGAFAVSRLEGGIVGPVEGYLIHWVGPRRYMMIGAVIFGLGLVGIGLSQSIPQFYVAFLIATLGQSVAGFLPIVTVLVNWFQRWRGRAIGVYQLGNSFGALLVPLVAWLILNLGWRQSIIGMGIFATLVGVPLAAMMRSRPEDHGYLPDGAQPSRGLVSETTESAASGNQPAESGGSDITIGQALRGRNFWLLGVAHALSITAFGVLRVHEIPALVDLGFAEQTAANIFAMSMIVSAGGRLLGGFLGDMLGARRVLVVAFLLQGASVLILAYASSLFHVLVFAVLFGVSFGARGTLITVLRGDLFGRTNFSRLSGLMDPMSAAGAFLSPLLGGLVFDLRGSYRIAFLIIAALNVAGTVLLFWIRFPGDARVRVLV